MKNFTKIIIPWSFSYTSCEIPQLKSLGSHSITVFYLNQCYTQEDPEHYKLLKRINKNSVLNTSPILDVYNGAKALYNCRVRNCGQ